jgi:hypothetical protein
VTGQRAPAAEPPCWRLLLGFIAGPAAALALSLISPLSPEAVGPLRRTIETTVIVLMFVYPITLVTAVPAYLVLRSRLRPSLLNCALVGGGVAVLPWLLLSLITPNEAWTGKVVTVHNHVRTAAGWLELLQNLGPIASLGALAGFVFWCAVTLGRAGPAHGR